MDYITLRTCVLLFYRYSTYLRFAYISEDEPLLVTVYYVGTICYLIYVPIFYVYCHKKGKMLFRLLVTMTLQFAIALYDMHEYDYTTVRRNVGYVNGLFYISLHIIPLAKVSSIINTTHRTEGLSYVGILSSFIVTFFWSIGGIFDWNPYVRVPNIVCCLYSIRVIELYIRHSRRRR
ncbi:uncharacterized protein [Anabrus simplex]|uniref:uncharacterized protein isoform X1 n=1 Tax=Anabrus simplex TaxID=316456 RepID=UPI0034DDC2C5